MPSVEECLAHPLLGRTWGVDSPSEIRVADRWIEMPCVQATKVLGMKIEYYRLPTLFISGTVSLWLNDYSVKKEYGTNTEYDNFHPCYIYGLEIYSKFLRGVKNEQQRSS